MNPKSQDAMQRDVIAGMKVMYGEQTRQHFIDGLRSAPDIGTGAAQEVAGILKLLDDKAQYQIPKDVIIPAAMALLMDLFRLLHDAGIEFSEDDVKTASAKVVELLMSEYQLMQQIADDHGAQQQPPGQPPAPAAGLINGGANGIS